jgi:hypothetical protein
VYGAGKLCTVQHSCVRYNTVVYGAVQLCTVQQRCVRCSRDVYGAVEKFTVQQSCVRCSTVVYGAVKLCTVQYSCVQCSTIVYSADVVTSLAANKRNIRFGNTLCSEICVCHVWCTADSELSNAVALSCICPTYRTDRQCKVKTDSSCGLVQFLIGNS